jgi:D-3-phosphoglycerate dehydrogenase
MSDRFKVFVADPIHEGGLALLREHFEVLYPGPDADMETKNAAAEKADAIIVRLYKITQDLLPRCPNLKAVIKHGIGVDNIDIDACTKRGVLVANTPGGSNAHCVAEGAVTLMLAVYRRVRERHEAILAGKFMQARNTPVTESLWGKTVGVMGFGQIGRFTARICGQGFDCKVLAYDPWASDEVFAAAGVERVTDLADFLKRSDAVSIHVPLSKETHHLIGAAELAMMKPTAILVNTARGGIVDEAALAAALRDGVIAGAGIDVFQDEPPHADNPLLSAPNIVLSPHVAGMSQDSLRELGVAVAEATAAALARRMPATTLNRDVWPDVAGQGQ